MQLQILQFTQHQRLILYSELCIECFYLHPKGQLVQRWRITHRKIDRAFMGCNSKEGFHWLGPFRAWVYKAVLGCERTEKKPKHLKPKPLLNVPYIWRKLREGGSNNVPWPASAYVLIREKTESHQEKCKVSEPSSPGQEPSVLCLYRTQPSGVFVKKFKNYFGFYLKVI